MAQDHAYDDLVAPLVFLPGARDALLRLKAAGHVLVLWSARSSRSLLIDPFLDPLVRAGRHPVNPQRWEAARPLHQARLVQMLDFIDAQLPGVFDAVDDGAGGKPQVDLFIDDRALRFGFGPAAVSWGDVAHLYGELVQRGHDDDRPGEEGAAASEVR